jgi:hypothetical protein
MNAALEQMSSLGKTGHVELATLKNSSPCDCYVSEATSAF